MNLIPAEIKTQFFPCPNCGQFISDEVDVCKFCITEITAAMKRVAIDHERADKKRLALGSHKNTLTIALFLWLASIGFFFQPIFIVHWIGVNVSCLLVVALILAIGFTVFGLLGYYKEKKS